ncbi:MAG: hypothetical protein JWM19_4921 [Actinomycetia bacterium]|nr:hypothetical protein [Actinomycetes bacterium]
MRSMSAIRCEEITTLTPCSATTSIRPWRNSRRASGSRLAAGSSRIITSGRLAIARVRASWARWPPDSDPARCRGSRPSCSTRRRASAASQPGLSQPPRRRWSATESRRNTGVSWATKPTRASWPGPLAGGMPRTLMVPAVGVSSPTAMCSRVVLPAPLGPTSPTTRPAGMASVQSRSAQLRAYRLPRPLASMTAFMPPPRRSCRGTRRGRSPRCRPARGRPRAPSAASRPSRRGTAPA